MLLGKEHVPQDLYPWDWVSRCLFRAILGTGCVWCGSCPCPYLHGDLKLLKLEEKEQPEEFLRICSSWSATPSACVRQGNGQKTKRFNPAAAAAAARGKGNMFQSIFPSSLSYVCLGVVCFHG